MSLLLVFFCFVANWILTKNLMTNFPRQVGSYELSVVNVHMQARAAPGESNGKNHNTDEAKCPHLPPSIQETLKGQSVRSDQ